jgi:hypothetical protein
MAPFKELVAVLNRTKAASLVWTLCGARGGKAIRIVIMQIQSELPEADAACTFLLEHTNDELEDHHARAFKLFSVCVAPDTFEPLRADAAVALTPREAAVLRHKQVLKQRTKK